MAKKIDILIAGSANDAFFSRIAFARLSLDALGGDYRNARVVAALAEYERPEIPARWAPYFANIDVVWSNPEGLPNPGWDLQHQKRFEVMRDDADVAIIWDADVCALRPFDDLLERVARDQTLAGVIAHYHFPIDGARGDPDVEWPQIANAVLGHDIDRPHRYLFGRAPGAGGGPIADPEQRPRAPFYLNYGVVMAPPALLRRMFEREQALRPAVSRITGDVWAAQVGLALACAEQSLPTLALPVRYNYANRPETDELYPEELDEIVLFHYMFDRNLKRNTVFAERDAFQAFVDTRYEGADERLRRHIVKITGGRYPFPPP